MRCAHRTSKLARALAAACLVLVGLQPRAGVAGSFEVNPIRIDLSAAARTSAVTIKNTGPEAVVVQLSVVAWSQEDGRDIYAETKEILATPPIATIPAGGEQIVRAGLRRSPDGQRELSYRLFLQEVPPPPRPGFQGLQVALRVGLPVFVQPAQAPARARLVWDLRMKDPGTVRLQLRNDGTAHIQISEIALSLPGRDDPVGAMSSLFYVLPGQSRAWEFQVRPGLVKATDRLRLKASTDAGSVDTQIDLATP
jgi:fimbrial chaperone protein